LYRIFYTFYFTHIYETLFFLVISECTILKDRTVGNHGKPVRVVCFRRAICKSDLLITMLLDCDVLFGPTGTVASALTARQNGLRHCHHCRTLKLAHTRREAGGVITLLDGKLQTGTLRVLV
jgi:hypothetical protein